MSSATSIKQTVRLKPDTSPVRLKTDAVETADAGFRPWHFFVLMSLVAATAAVLMSRQSSPEHLIFVSATIAAAGAAAAAFYRMLAPLAADDVSIFSDPLTERGRAALEREKMLVLRSIKELEFDRAMGKVSPKDFDEMASRLRARAVALLKQLDENESGYRGIIEREVNARLASRPAAVTSARESTSPSGTSCACGTANDADARFCKACGASLGAVTQPQPTGDAR